MELYLDCVENVTMETRQNAGFFVTDDTIFIEKRLNKKKILPYIAQESMRFPDAAG